MKKLRLDLDAVKLESFGTTPRPLQGKGTVFAKSSYTVCYTCEDMTCENSCVTLEPTCTGYSVAATCGQSCGGGDTCAGYTCEWTDNDTCYGSCTADGCTICDRAC